MAYAVYTTESFDKNSSKLLKGKEDRLRKIFFQIRDNPYGATSFNIKT